MKIQIPSHEIQHILARSLAVIPSRPMRESERNISFVASDGILTTTVSDSAISLQMFRPCDITEEGECSLSCEVMEKAIRNAPVGPVHISLHDDVAIIEFASAKISIPPASHPVIQPIANDAADNLFQFDAEGYEILALIKSVEHAAGEGENLKQVETRTSGVIFECSQESSKESSPVTETSEDATSKPRQHLVTAFATNHLQAAINSAMFHASFSPSASLPQAQIITDRAIKAMKPFLQSDENVVVSFSKDTGKIAGPYWNIRYVYPHGVIPPFRRMVQTASELSIASQAKASQLLKSLRCAASVLDGTTKGITVTISRKEINFSGSGQLGKSNTTLHAESNEDGDEYSPESIITVNVLANAQAVEKHLASFGDDNILFGIAKKRPFVVMKNNSKTCFITTMQSMN